MKRVFFACAGALIAACSIAIVPDNPVATLPGVGKVGSVSGATFNVGGTGVAISPTWILTAAHVGGDKFEQNGIVFQIVQTVNHPTADLSLRRVAVPFGTALPMKLNYFSAGVPTQQTNLAGEILKLQGYGWTGNWSATGFTTITGTQGTLRQCRNRLDLFIPNVQVDIGGGVIKTTDYIFYDLDDPTGASTVNVLGGPAVGTDEGGMSTFDSGCPWTLFENSRDRVVGIGGIIGFFQGTGVTRALDWGGFGGAANLQSYASWITSNVNDYGRAILNPISLANGSISSGSVTDLYLSDNISIALETRLSDVDSVDAQTIFVSGTTTQSPPVSLAFVIEGRSTTGLSWCSVDAFNPTTGLYSNVGGFFVTRSDIVQTVTVPSPASFVGSLGEVQMRLRLMPITGEPVVYKTFWDTIRINAQ